MVGGHSRAGDSHVRYYTPCGNAGIRDERHRTGYTDGDHFCGCGIVPYADHGVHSLCNCLSSDRIVSAQFNEVVKCDPEVVGVKKGMCQYRPSEVLREGDVWLINSDIFLAR